MGALQILFLMGRECDGTIKVRLDPGEYTVGEFGWNEVPRPGHYLVTPLDAVTEQEAVSVARHRNVQGVPQSPKGIPSRGKGGL